MSIILTILCFLIPGASGKSFYEIGNDISKTNVITLLIISRFIENSVCSDVFVFYGR